MDNDQLFHYGMPKRSGRYPYGSGDSPYQHDLDFLGRVAELKKLGKSEVEIAKMVGCANTNTFRKQYREANENRRLYQLETIKSLLNDGLSKEEIARKTGIPASTQRSMLKTESETRLKQSRLTADNLKKIVEEKGMIDVGAGVEREIGIPATTMKQALHLLEKEGYPIYNNRLPYATDTSKTITQQILCKPGTENREIYDASKVHSLKEYKNRYDEEGNPILEKGFVYPKSMDSKRIFIRYAEDGGLQKDGTVEIRRGVDDLSLGESRYAQVRILVDNDKYIKGMAVYSNNIPDGYDMVVNSNKPKGSPLEKVLKPIHTEDPDNPFGSLIKEDGGQSYYYDKDGKRQLSLINKRAEEGDWRKWKDKIATQFLAKQNLDLIKKQLDITYDINKAEYDDICALTNPVLKKKLLADFASGCDSSAVHLKAAAFPRQKFQVILPINSLKDNEVYAPNFKDGETLALVRFPHGGTFEIPILKVNNRNKEAIDCMTKTPSDAIGINSKVAERLSGADFDGDTVMAIPCNSPHSPTVRITNKDPLPGLVGFDPKAQYPYREGMQLMKRTVEVFDKKTNTVVTKTIDNTQKQMGMISNLITDMTIKGANDDELARAVRHSMVVIDAAKHKLDYKKSEMENRIDELKKEYQGGGGASTLFSKATSETRIPKRKGSGYIDRETGELVYKVDNATYLDERGNERSRTITSTQMAETKDARTLSSGTIKEDAYANYANKMKSLANTARKEYINTRGSIYKKEAREKYAAECESLEAKLRISELNAPREREAQRIANTAIKGIRTAYPYMDKKELKKIRQKEIVKARIAVGAKRTTISITDKEWEAIQAGALTSTKMAAIFDHADMDSLRQRATPRSTTSIPSSKLSLVNKMVAKQYTASQIADSIGVSSSNIQKYLDNKRLASRLRSEGKTLEQIADRLGVSESTISVYLE